MAQEFDERDFDTHHDQLIDPPEPEPATVEAEILPNDCNPPQFADSAPANFPLSQSEYERITGTKRQTTSARITKIDGILGRLGSCLDKQKRITEQGHQWLSGYVAADDKADYLDELKAELQDAAMSGGSALALTTAASDEMSTAISTERDRLTNLNADLDLQWEQAMQSLRVIAQAESDSQEIDEMEQQALDRQLDLECLAEIAQERQSRASRKVQRKAELRAQVGLA